jgi:hypothetical protein
MQKNLPIQSLKGSVIRLFKTDIIQYILDKYNSSGKCILILDEKSSHLISNYFSVTDIISQGVFSVELLSKSRKPFENYEAIYIISNSTNSLNLMVKDFDFDLEEKKHLKLYQNCHLYVIDPIEENKNFFEPLLNAYFLKNIKTFNEIFFDFVPLDKNLYYFGQNSNFNPIYQMFCVNDNKTQNNICIEKLYSICLVTNTFPNIIYFIHDQSCKYIAVNLNKKLEAYFYAHKKGARNGTLLISSRLMDLTAPIQFDTNYDHLLFESYKSNSDPDKKMINIDLKGKGQKQNIILDHNDILYNKYKLYSFIEIANILPDDFEKFKNSDIAKVNKVNQMESLNEMNQAIRHFNEYQYKTKLFSQHLDLAGEINQNCQKRNIMSLIDLQSSIMSGMNEKGEKLSQEELISKFLNNKNKFQKNDLKRLLYLLRYYNRECDINELNEQLGNVLNLNKEDMRLIEQFTVEGSLIDEQDLKRIVKQIVLFRQNYRYNTPEEKEKKSDKRFLCVKESKLTTLCDMCCKNELPDYDFQYVVKPTVFKNNNNNNNGYKADILIQNQDMDIQSDIPLNIDNLIVFNVGGLSTYEISSLEKANKNKQFNMNIIYGSNQIYNHEEYVKCILEYFKGNNGLKQKVINNNINYNNNNIINVKDNIIDINDSKGKINTYNTTLDNLNYPKDTEIDDNEGKNIITNSDNHQPKFDKGSNKNSFLSEDSNISDYK